jgi:hypothetical protein
MIDQSEIINALRLWFRPGDVFEVRALDAVSADYMRPHVESGYFDYAHIEDVPKALARLRACRGVYVTLNPVNPALLARAKNRIRSVGREPTTTDADIQCRRWLPVDCDAERPAGISSDAVEHEAAQEKARKIRDGLAQLGWPEPIMIDSGNGAQLLYAVDLPAKDDQLVQKFLTEIAAAGDERVKIDLSVHNPARIWRLPGTMNCKGDDTPDRPHRMAKIVSAPECPVIVEREKIAKIAAKAEPEMEAPRPPARTEAPANRSNLSGFSIADAPKPQFNIDRWIGQYAPELGEPRPWQGGRRWVFDVCPFNDVHTNRSAVLLEMPDGAVAFTCLHNSCSGNDWHAFRALREPPAPVAASKRSVTRESPPPSYVPFPAELFQVPGFVAETIEFCMRTAPYPNLPLAFAGALVLQAHLAARKVEAPGGTRTNPYLVVLAKSGCGKDHPRKLNNSVLCGAGIGNEIIENIASGQALEDTLLLTPALLWQADEFYSFLQEVANDRTGQKENIMKYLLSFFTSANISYTPRVKVGREAAKIICPNLTIMGSCTPGGFFDSLNERMLAHGMYSRMTIIHADSRGKGQLPGDLEDIPDRIADKAKLWADFRPPGSGNLDMKAMTVPMTAGAKKLLVAVQAEADDIYAKIERQENCDWKMAIWSRACENTTRFALIHACSEAEKPEGAVITEEAILWAKKFIWWEAANKIAMTEHHYHETEFERYSEEIVTILANWHQRKGYETPMPGWLFNRKTKKFPPKVLAAVQQSLMLQERLECVTFSNNGKSGIMYQLKGGESTDGQ